MPKTITSAEHIKQLELLHDYLDEDGWEVTLKAPDKENPLHMLVVSILSEDDHNQVLWNMELSFVPIPAANLSDVSILQCFIPLANDFAGLLKPDLFEMITKLNTKLPIVGFGFLDDYKLLYYKHNMMLPNAETPIKGLVLSESLSMITYLVSTYTGPLITVATGEKSMTDVINDLQAQKLFS
ncbi:hypothetical protein [Mucilaginibacter phyllosphaerae]|uniref:YbjN domain-containing protein n=1 Tax=Mucilaginibacter phyllosphaerae TaxID=1812349 RepID=A0A4Y8ABW7_9SPHI|nr:hypothetical protein [Mucilaginibacter phyllosphaerae]MBB3969176.1 hypothetical protein [Mucilaginibacter phyllosphaerae]TEW66017.1 hypothetical protein E2R65_12895 [Mucilaginibacter phyllosphaerae]GGH06800.1 hypothetical protein GCM10007352_11190 [Mucilaginibacter phyllosphaerae]